MDKSQPRTDLMNHVIHPRTSLSRFAIFATALLLLANVIVPLVWGDVYPFTSAPMFRDCPTQFCSYHVFAPDGTELPASDWQVQRVYDGNPVGYGVGVCPPAVIELTYGEIHEQAACCQHIQAQFSRPTNRKYEYVEIVQDIVGAVDSQHVGIVRNQRWRVERP